MLSTTELAVIGGLLLLFFGSTQIPKLARSLGRAKGDYRRALDEMKDGEREKERSHDPFRATDPR